MINGIIIEGLSTSGKTSLYSALKKIHNQIPKSQRTMVAIDEHYSQVLHQEHGEFRSLQQDEHIKFLLPHIEYLERLNDWMKSLGQKKTSSGVFFLFERFHLNHRAAFGAGPEILGIEKRLTNLNAHAVLLTLSPDAVESRFINSRGEDWKSYVMKDSNTVTEACQKFLDGQEKLRLCVGQSQVPTTEIITDEAEWDSYAEHLISKIVNEE